MLEGLLTLNNTAIVLFVLAVAYFLWRDQDKIERKSILFVRRTDKGIELLDRVAKRFPRLWKVWSSLGVLVAFGVMAVALYFLTKNFLKVIMVPEAVAGVRLVLPTPSTQLSLRPGVMLIPFWYWIVAIGSVAAVHELMHGVVGRNEGFNIKSVGWFILGIIPGAFVEPEGEDMMPGSEEEKTSEGPPWSNGNWISKLRVLAAGSFSNITVAFIVFLVIFGATTGTHGGREVKGLYNHEGVEVAQVVNGTAAEEAGLKKGMVVTYMNGEEIKDLKDFEEASNLTINDSIEVRGNYNGTSFNKTVKIGVKPEKNKSYSPAPVDYVLVPLESRFPGSIETYEEHNNFIVPEDKETQLLRWKWIKEDYDSLDDKADERIEKLGGKIENKEEPYLGIAVLPEREVKAGLAWLETPVLVLMKLFLFLTMIHLGVGVFNMLPLKPLDGGWMFSTLVEHYKPEWEGGLSRVVSAFTLFVFVGILAFSIVPAVL
ncbi:MAG: site-2 protease family protein [Candidatus Nanohaloarchaeota archaeon QJJ-9]|nr:site-2 protease family protein [Candidatus Nanohaloarchaeota archaeon QJJ-9]